MPYVQTSCTSGRVGLNSDLYSSFGRARPDEQGKYLTFFKDNAEVGTYDPSTGLPLTGEWKLAVRHQVPDVYPDGMYGLNWTGGGTGPGSVMLNPGDDLKNYTFNGNLANFTMTRTGVMDEWNSTFLDRMSCAYSFRWMEAQRVNPIYYDSINPFVREVPGLNNLNVHRIPTPEDIRDLANLTGCIPWINIHCEATDADILDFAQRLVGIQTKVRVSFANETWNDAVGNSFNCADAKAQAALYTGNQLDRISAYTFDMADKVAEIFKGVLGFPNVIGIVESWLRQPDMHARAFIHRKRPWAFLNAVALGYYAGGPWARATDPAIILGMSHEALINEARIDWETNVINDGGYYDQWDAIAQANGWEHAAYEAGIHLQHETAGPQTDDANDRMADAANSTWGGEFMDEMIGWWVSRNPLGAFMLFRETGDDVFGFRSFEHQAVEYPRFQFWRNYACGG